MVANELAGRAKKESQATGEDLLAKGGASD